MRTLLYVIILFVITGCSCSGSRYGRELDEAQSLLEEDPLKALERLNGLDVTAFDDSSTIARWALLYSEAMAANGVYAPTDTIPDIASDYYSNHGGEDELERIKLARQRLESLPANPGERMSFFSAMYLAKEREWLLYKERADREKYLLAGFAVIMLAGMIIVRQRGRLRLRSVQYETLMAEASGLREGISRERSVCSELESKLSSILSRRFDTIDELCGTYYESQGTKIERKAVAEKVKSQIDALKSDKEMLSEMERCVNDCRGGMMDILRGEWPDIRLEEYRLMLYLSCNFSNRTIALLLGESLDVVYKRKSRLKAKITSSGMSHASLFLTVF